MGDADSNLRDGLNISFKLLVVAESQGLYVAFVGLLIALGFWIPAYLLTNSGLIIWGLAGFVVMVVGLVMAGVALTGYLGVSGTHQLAYDGMLYVNSKVSFKKVLDGTSNTLLAGERPPSADLVWGWRFAGSGQYPYFGATDVTLGVNEIKNPASPLAAAATDIFRLGSTIDLANEHCWHFWSLHPHGSNFLFVDGAVRFIRYDIGQPTLNALATRAGGETLALPTVW